MARIVYGVHPVREALRAGRVEAFFVAEGDPGLAMREVLEAAKKANVPPVEKSRASLDALAHGAAHQGVIAITGDYPYKEIHELVDAARREGRPPLILVLDSVQDPQNLGGLIRTAHVAGLHGVVIAKDRAAAITPTVVKASAGATEHMRVAQVINIARALEELKESDLWIAGAVAQGGQEPWRADLKVPLAIVLGAEGKGIRPLVLRGCDLLLRIPMMGKVASLNVAAAGAMLLYETIRQRAM